MEGTGLATMTGNIAGAYPGSVAAFDAVDAFADDAVFVAVALVLLVAVQSAAARLEAEVVVTV